MTRIIVACDNMSPTEIYTFAQKNRSKDYLIKINSALAEVGVSLIDSIHHPNHFLPDGSRRQVMADPKYHDIPNTIANYCRNLTSRDPFKRGRNIPEILTVHMSGGVVMMATAQNNLTGSAIYGVGVLTSIGHQTCIEIYRRSPKKQMEVFADMALEAGIAGIVFSPLELKMIRSKPRFDRLKTLVPGIRPTYLPVKNDDQKRYATPAQAVRWGADDLVIGRPITEAPDPILALQRIREEIESVCH